MEENLIVRTEMRILELEKKVDLELLLLSKYQKEERDLEIYHSKREIKYLRGLIQINNLIYKKIRA